MKTVPLLLLCALLFAACAAQKAEPAQMASSEPPPPVANTAEATAAAAGVTPGTWAGQLKIDAHAGTATLTPAGNSDVVPLRFRTGSEAAAKVFAECADEDLCKVEGTASAAGEIVKVDRVQRLPQEAP